MIGTHALVMMVVRVLLEYGLPWLEDFTADKKALVKQKVFDACPKFPWFDEKVTDELAWVTIEFLWDTIIRIVKSKLIAQNVVQLPTGHPKVWPTMIAVVSELESETKKA